MLQECDRVLFAITDVFILSLLVYSVFLFIATYQVLASVVFPGGYTAVDWEFRGFKQGHCNSGRWREKKSCAHNLHRKQERGKEQEKKNELSLRVLYLKYLADMLSDSEVRGDDCIDRFHSLIISEKESESRPEQKMLLLQKHTINHHMQFVLNEN